MPSVPSLPKVVLYNLYQCWYASAQHHPETRTTGTVVVPQVNNTATVLHDSQARRAAERVVERICFPCIAQYSAVTSNLPIGLVQQSWFSYIRNETYRVTRDDEVWDVGVRRAVSISAAGTGCGEVLSVCVLRI